MFLNIKCKLFVLFKFEQLLLLFWLEQHYDRSWMDYEWNLSNKDTVIDLKQIIYNDWLY